MKILSVLHKIGTNLFVIQLSHFGTWIKFSYTSKYICFYVYTFSGVNLPIGSCSKHREFWDTYYINVKPQSKS